jgi:phosphoglycerate dehydrogenase-like enzyme
MGTFNGTALLREQVASVLHELEFANYLPYLQALADVQIWDGAGNPSQQALDDACANAQILITGWGVPFLSQLDRWERDNSPLRLVMHSAGTVKQLVPVDSITRGLQVSRANDSLAESVAEFTVGAIIMARRKKDKRMMPRFATHFQPLSHGSA